MIAKQILDDFPNNLPKEMNEKLEEDMTKLMNYFANIVIHKKITKTPKFQSEIFLLIIELALAETFDFEYYEKGLSIQQEHLFQTKMSELFKNEKLKSEKYKDMTLEDYYRKLVIEKDTSVLEIYEGNINEILKKAFNFERILLSVELVFLFANLEAFLIESLKVICLICPNSMITKEKNYSKEDIIEQGSWENLINFFVEDESFKLGKQSLEEKLESFKRFGIELSDLSIDMEFIIEINQIRNLIVHNGGIINQEYIKKTGKKSLRVGNLIPLDTILLGKSYNEFSNIVQGLFKIIGEKFLH